MTGITDKPHCPKWWSAAQKALLQQLRDDNVPWDEVAIRCGHTIGSCRTVLSKLQSRHLVRAAGDPMARKPARPWTEAEVAQLIQLYEIDARLFREIDHQLGRPTGSSAVKYAGLRRPAARSMISREARVEIDQTAFAERAARKLAENQRGLTASFFGDPPKGYSALDRRTGVEP